MVRALRITGLLPLGGAVLLSGYTFALNPGVEQMLFVNPLFGAAAFVCAVLWVHSLTWPNTQTKAEFSILSSYATVALLCAEVIPWVWRMSPQWSVDPVYTSWWVSAMLLSACAAVYLAVGRFKRSIEAYSSGLVPLALAWVC